MSSSCLKIISCGHRDSFQNHEDHVDPSPQGKDKRGWSFRKRSARHRVLSNTVTSETASSGNKATPVSTAIDFECQPNSGVPEKKSAVVCKEEKSKFSTPVSSKLSETIAAGADEPNSNAKSDELDAKSEERYVNPDEPDSKLDESDGDVKPDELNDNFNLNESVVTVIQSAIRAFLAQKVMLESKKVIKLQAAVRGHLERRHAVGTLRCVQAIIKMQALVRARRIRILEGESIAVEGSGKGKENMLRKPHVTYTSIERLLSNKFARQLMDSTPRTKSISIKCDPSKSDSAWKWLERWMAVSPTDDQPRLGTVVQHENNRDQTATQAIAEGEIVLVSKEDTVILHDKKLDKDVVSQEQTSVLHDGKEGEIDLASKEDTVILHDKKQDKDVISQEQTSVLHDEKVVENFVPQEQILAPSESNCKPVLNLSSEVSGSHPKFIMHDENRLGIQTPELTSELSHTLKQLDTHNTVNTESEQINSVLDETKELELPCRRELSINNVSGETETRSEQSFESQERSALEKSETQGNKLIAGSRKASDPNFLAAQSKFKELSSVSNLTKSMSSTSQTAEDESYVDSVSSFTDQASGKESGPVVDLISCRKMLLGNSDTSEVQFGSNPSKIQLGGSECGTELSLTSTLDSPERSDVGPSEIELEGKVMEDMKWLSQSKDSSAEEAEVEPTIINTCIFDSNATHNAKYTSTMMGEEDHVASSVTEEFLKVEQKPETDVSKLQLEIEPEKGNSLSKPSPEASPRSHVTASEPQGTPSSQVSVKPKRTKGQKSGPNPKPRSLSAGKTSPSNPNYGSGGRSSVEKSHKDHKSAKRRNSFGSPKSDKHDQEPRDSSSSITLPSYMQPTESAKAKALLNNSPRSSPDVHDKDVTTKKRHSLPGGNGRQLSPQIQRTSSELQQTGKGNESQLQQDKKWRR